jgi:hypothetical protein
MFSLPYRDLLLFCTIDHFIFFLFTATNNRIVFVSTTFEYLLTGQLTWQAIFVSRARRRADAK